MKIKYNHGSRFLAERFTMDFTSYGESGYFPMHEYCSFSGSYE